MSFENWLVEMENLLSYINIHWNGLMIVTRDMNIDLLNPRCPMVVSYTSLLDSLNLYQHVKTPTRVTEHSKTLIDHIVSNILSCITYTNVLPISIVSDHDAPYACINFRVPRFKPRYKYIQLENALDIASFKRDFQALPLSRVYSLDNPDDQVDTLISCSMTV